MPFLFVGSQLCTQASCRRCLATTPLPSASISVMSLNITGFTYRGLSPHKFTPMPGVHKAMQPTLIIMG